MNLAVEWLEQRFKADVDLINRYQCNGGMTLTEAEMARVTELHSHHNSLNAPMFTLKCETNDDGDVIDAGTSWRPRHTRSQVIIGLGTDNPVPLPHHKNWVAEDL